MYLPLVPVRDLATNDVTVIVIYINVGAVPDKVPMDVGFQAFKEFIRGRHPKHANFVPPFGLREQGRPLDVVFGGAVEKGVGIRLEREIQEHVVF